MFPRCSKILYYGPNEGDPNEGVLDGGGLDGADIGGPVESSSMNSNCTLGIWAFDLNL